MLHSTYLKWKCRSTDVDRDRGVSDLVCLMKIHLWIPTYLVWLTVGGCLWMNFYFFACISSECELFKLVNNISTANELIIFVIKIE